MTDQLRVRALPLWQPWATLVVIGAKQIETRPKPAPTTILGQRVAIHACATEAHLHRRHDVFFWHYFATREAPLGALIGSVEVVSSEPITERLVEGLSPRELAFGDYRLGRWAWGLANPIALDEPVPWKASQGICFVPAEAAGFAAPQQAMLL